MGGDEAKPTVPLSEGRRFGRFAGVGVINTLIDFILFGVLSQLAWPMLAANAVSTTAGLTFSFLVNRRFTFGDRVGDARKQAILFVGGTLFGLWVIQPLGIWAGAAVLQAWGWTGPLAQIWLPKCAGIAAGLVWNYAFYSRIVFRPASHQPAADPERRPDPDQSRQQ